MRGWDLADDRGCWWTCRVPIQLPAVPRTHSNSFCLHDLRHWLTECVCQLCPTPNLAFDRPSFSHRILQVWEMLLLLCCAANCQMTWPPPPPAFPIAARASASSH